MNMVFFCVTMVISTVQRESTLTISNSTGKPVSMKSEIEWFPLVQRKYHRTTESGFPLN